MKADLQNELRVLIPGTQTEPKIEIGRHEPIKHEERMILLGNIYWTTFDQLIPIPDYIQCLSVETFTSEMLQLIDQ